MKFLKMSLTPFTKTEKKKKKNDKYMYLPLLYMLQHLFVCLFFSSFFTLSHVVITVFHYVAVLVAVSLFNNNCTQQHNSVLILSLVECTHVRFVLFYFLFWLFPSFPFVLFFKLFLFLLCFYVSRCNVKWRLNKQSVCGLSFQLIFIVFFSFFLMSA